MNRLALKNRPALLLIALLMMLAPASSAFAQVRGKGAQKPTAAAQASAPNQWIYVAEISIKPDKLLDYQEFIKKETLPEQKKGGLKWRHTWTTAVFGEGFHYYVVQAMDNFAQYDGQSAIVKALGEAGARDYNEKNRKLIDGVKITAMMARPDLSYETQMSAPPTIAVLSRFSIAPGRTQEFENFLKTDMLPVIRKSGVAGYWVNQTVMGGDGSEYTVLVPFASFADLDKGPPQVRVLGQAGAARLAQKTAGIVLHVERSVIRYLPDLSFETTPATQNR